VIFEIMDGADADSVAVAVPWTGAFRLCADTHPDATGTRTEDHEETEEAPKRRGNGEDRPAAGIDALKAAAL
jgi:hypothetical protein